MFCLFQLTGKLKNTAILLLAALLLTPLAGGVFAPEWNLDGRPAAKGRIDRIIEHFRDGDAVNVFDDAGRKILRTYPDSTSRQQIEMKMFYNSDGKLEKIECYAGGKLIYVEKGSYSEGLLRTLVRYDADGKELFWSTMMNYDERLLKLKSYGVQTKDGVVDYFYDLNEKGEITFIRAFIRNKLSTAAKYIYDKSGLVSEVRTFDAQMKNAGILYNEWKFDEQGNWIEKKSFFRKNNRTKTVPAAVFRRSIKYRK